MHQVVHAHLETFLVEVRLRNGGDGLPRFVERELREYLTCGVMARGFADSLATPGGSGKSEIRNPKQIRNLKFETSALRSFRISGFEFVSAFELL